MSKKSKGLGETPQNKQIVITPERIGLYLFGAIAVGGAFYLANSYIKDLKNKAEAYNNQKLNQGSVTNPLNPAGGAGNTGEGGGTGTTVVVDDRAAKIRELEAMIPRASAYGDVVKNGVKYYSDEFPIRLYAGGERVRLLQKALIAQGQASIINQGGGADGILGKMTTKALEQLNFSVPVTREQYLVLLSYYVYGKDYVTEGMGRIPMQTEEEELWNMLLGTSYENQ